MEQNKIKILSEKIGEFEILVSDYQLERLMEEGAKTLDEVKKDEAKELRKGRFRRPGDPLGSENTEGGFTGNTVDWSQYFPDVTAEEIDRLIMEALAHEKKIRTATSAVFVLVGVGVSAALTGNPASALGLVKVIEILGSYFSDSPNISSDIKVGEINTEE